ncbi:hypothetical protein RQP46_001700 [Phenoliferia psychrophenolica]
MLLRPLPLSRLLLRSTRPLSSSLPLRSATPDWQELIGGREVVDRKRAAFEDKYKAAFEKKARLEGLSVEQLKHKAAEEDARPLEDILDLSKATSLTPASISQLWTTYHQAKGFLSAAIPTATYERMSTVAKKYPLFVLPLARDIVGEDKPEGSAGAVEMHLLVSFVLFTPLAEYQARQSFAQPYLILTHYTDLSTSHGVVLMRGEISDNVALNALDAHVLSVRLQLFYHQKEGMEAGVQEKARRELLECFHERPEEFDVEKLVKTAWELD